MISHFDTDFQVFGNGADLTGYATEEFVQNTVENAVKDCVTEEFVEEKINNIEYPQTDLTGYATVEFVQKSISEIKHPQIDLTGYATRKQVENTLEDYPTKNYISSALKSYATKENVDEELEPYATKEFVVMENDKKVDNVILVEKLIPLLKSAFHEENLIDMILDFELALTGIVQFENLLMVKDNVSVMQNGSKLVIV